MTQSSTLREMEQKSGQASRALWIGTIAMAFIVLIPSCIGFGGKLYELFLLARTESDSGFALVPLCNYLLATAGFTCMLIWASMHGMFRNIEQPKFQFYDREIELDKRFHTASPEDGPDHG